MARALAERGGRGDHDSFQRTARALDALRSGRELDAGDLRVLDGLRIALNALATRRELAARPETLGPAHPGRRADALLSPREREILDLVAAGGSNVQIASRLSISPGTVKKHLENIYAKLGVGSRTEALARTGRSLVINDEAPATATTSAVASS